MMWRLARNALGRRAALVGAATAGIGLGALIVLGPMSEAGPQRPRTTVIAPAASVAWADAGTNKGPGEEKSTMDRVRDFLIAPYLDLAGAVRKRVNDFIETYTEPSKEVLLPDPIPDGFGVAPRTLVLEADGILFCGHYERAHGWRYIKRPGVDLFLTRMFQAGYEIVIFTHGMQGVLDLPLFQLDKHRVISHRLYRDSTTYRSGVHVKDLSRLNRQLGRIVMIDHDRSAFQFQPDSGLVISKFEGDQTDSELLKLIPFLETIIREDIRDIREVTREYGDQVADHFREQRQRSKEQQRSWLTNKFRKE